jgi:intracellular sulfur oxidation DsrE/DsrF family protein
MMMVVVSNSPSTHHIQEVWVCCKVRAQSTTFMEILKCDNEGYAYSKPQS